MSIQPAAKRHRIRYSISIRSMMLLVLVLGLWMGWTINRAESRRQAVAALKKNGAIVIYDYESMRGIKTPSTKPWAPAWLRMRLGDDYFQNVTYVNMTPAIGHTYELTDRDLAFLKALDRVEELVIVETPITDAGLDYIQGLTDLRILVLINIDAALPNVHLSDAGMARLQWMTKLERLELHGTDISDAGLVHLSRMTELQSLGLRETKVTGAGLANLSRMKKLKTLILDRTPLTDTGLCHLRGMVSLQELRIGGTKTTDAGLANLAGLTALRRLDLGFENSSDVGLAHLAALTNIQVLELAGPRVTDAGMVRLAEFKNLRELYTDDTRVTDIGLVHLRGLSKLTSLSLNGAAGVTDAGLDNLRGMSQLRSLFLDSTNVSDLGLAALRSALPTLVRTTNRKPKPGGR
jgi:internalin A